MTYSCRFGGNELNMSAYLVWMDLEMTGLNPGSDVILEIATIITDFRLEEVAVGPDLAIATPEAKLEAMDNWNQNHHKKSGLLERVRRSSLTLDAAQAKTLDFVKQHVAAKEAPLCGNSIWQDRRFLALHMSELEQFFHYRVVDVSSIKVLAKQWRPELFDGLEKKNAHRALADIRESIAELAFYRREFFKL